MEYVAKADAQLAELRSNCKRMKIPVEPQQYSVSPLQNMKQRLHENYSEINTDIPEDKVHYKPHGRKLSSSVRRNLIVSIGLTGVFAVSATAAYILHKTR